MSVPVEEIISKPAFCLSNLPENKILLITNHSECPSSHNIIQKKLLIDQRMNGENNKSPNNISPCLHSELSLRMEENDKKNPSDGDNNSNSFFSNTSMNESHINKRKGLPKKKNIIEEVKPPLKRTHNTIELYATKNIQIKPKQNLATLNQMSDVPNSLNLKESSSFPLHCNENGLLNKNLLIDGDTLMQKVKSQEDEITQLKNQKTDLQKQNEALMNTAKDLQRYKQSCFNSFKMVLFELESKNKKLNRISLNDNIMKFGKPGMTQNGLRLVDFWEEGEEIKKIIGRINLIKLEKEATSKLKKNLKAHLKSTKPEASLKVKVDDLYNEIETESLKLMLLKKEEADLNTKLIQLQVEKSLFQYEYYRSISEENSRFLKNIKEPKVIGDHYVILSLIGKGGYSEVYKAFDLEKQCYVACKLHQVNEMWEPSYKANYIRHALREQEIHVKLNHPRIVRQFDVVEVDDNSFITVLELCDGPSLDIYLKQHGSLNELEAKSIIFQILLGLKYLNEQDPKIIHYDLKPQNILFHKNEIKISDFGLAKVIDSNAREIELTSQGIGTYYYLPPETFADGKSSPMISSKVDVWSTGVILYELLFGKKPFGQNMSQARFYKEREFENTANKLEFPDKTLISEDCKQFIKNCLECIPIKRFDVLAAFNSPFIKKLNQKKKKSN